MDHLKKKALLKTLCSFFWLLLYKILNGPKKKNNKIANTLLPTDLPSTTAHISYIYSVDLTKNVC